MALVSVICTLCNAAQTAQSSGDPAHVLRPAFRFHSPFRLLHSPILNGFPVHKSHTRTHQRKQRVFIDAPFAIVFQQPIAA